MNELVQFDWFALVLVGIGTMLLFGEILVNMRGIFAIVGLISITYYFYAYIPDTATFVMMLVIYFVGLLLILIDGKFISDGTLAMLGIVAIFISVAITAPNFTAGLYAVIGVVIGAAISFVFLKFLPGRNMWSKITLKDRLTEEKGYSTLSEEHAQLLNERGVTKTDLRPSGTALINKRDYSVVSNGQWIKKGTKVIVINVDGTKIVVEKIAE